MTASQAENTEKGTVNNTVPEYSPNPYQFAEMPKHLLKVLRTSNLNGNEFRIILYIFELTIGYSTNGKVRQYISKSEKNLAKELNLSERTVNRAMKKFHDAGVLEILEEYIPNRKSRVFRINLNTYEWSEPVSTDKDIDIKYKNTNKSDNLVIHDKPVIHNIHDKPDWYNKEIVPKIEREETPPDLSLTPEQIKQVQEAFSEGYLIIHGTTYTGNNRKIFAQIGERIKTKMQDKGLPETQLPDHSKDLFTQAAESVKSNPFLRKFTPQLIVNYFDEYYDQHAFKPNSSDSEIGGALW